MAGKHKVQRAGRSGGDLGQKEAELEKTSEEQLRHMEGGKAAEAAVAKKRNISRSSQRRKK